MTEIGRNETKMHGTELWKVKPNKDAGVGKRAVQLLDPRSSSTLACACMARE